MTGDRHAVAAVRARRLSLAIPATVVLPAAFAVAAAIGYALAAVYRHDHYGSNAQDLGVYDQTIWGYSLLEMIPNTVTHSPNLLGDHFEPILMAVAPLFWVWDDVRMLLLLQGALLAAASLPIFFWARRELGTLPALGFQLAYLVFWGVIGGDLYDFHEVAIAAPIVSLALYGLLTGRPVLLLAMALLAFLTKENLALTFAAIGIYAVVAQRRYRLGLGLFAVSVGWFAIVLKVVIPAISGTSYAHWEYQALGSGPGEALGHVVRHPVDTVRLFFTPSAKARSLFNLFAPWLFLPLASPLLIVALPSLAERFLSSRPEFWAQGFHYSLVLAPILAFAAVDATVRLRGLVGAGRRELATAAVAGCTLLAGMYFTFGRIKPLDELRRYTTSAQIAQIDSCLATIPSDASVSATSALVPHLSHRRVLYWLQRRPLPATQFYAVDTSTWHFPLELGELKRLVERRRAGGYGVRCSRGGTVVLERGAPAGRLDPELRRIFRNA
jgi:uncharacterized membrane protein